jgi:Ca2+-binding EF-hand superfamily protein
LREILSALDDKLGPEDLDGIIAEIDTDGSGTVDFDGEFFLAKHPQRMYSLGTEAQALYQE